MIEVKGNFQSGLDMDNSLFAVPKNAYIDALNVTRDAIEGSHDSEITNIVGNQKVNYSYPSSGITIGAFPYELRNVIIFFRYSATGYNGVYEYSRSTGIITKIFESLVDSATDILGFTLTGKINNVNIYPSDTGDLLFFLDSLGRPTEMNITRFKAGEYTPVERSIIDVIKIPPLSPISCIYGSDTTRRTNSLRNKEFRFKYRFWYDDNETSVCSPISQMALPLNVLNDTYTSVVTNNNVIQLSVGSGAKNVKSVEILVSYADKTNSWSDFASVEVYNKSDHSISDNIVFSYSFYNDSTYPVISILESIQLYDYVPDYAGCQTFANGNVPIYGNVTEGLSRTYSANIVLTVNTYAATTGGTVGTLTSTLVFNNSILSFQYMQYSFAGIPATGTRITVLARRRSDGVEFNIMDYTTIAGDTSDSIIDSLIATITGGHTVTTHPSDSNLGIRFETGFFEEIPATGLYSTVTITAPSTSLAPNSIATWPFSTSRNIAIGYFNSQGKTNGILYHAKVSFPAYAENGSHIPLLPYVNVKIYNVPPAWAASYQIYFTKEPTIPFWWVSVAVNKDETDYIYFDVTNFDVNTSKNPTTSKVLSYSFQDGDRLRLIKRLTDGNVFDDTYDAAVIGLVAEPTINSVFQKDKKFIKIKKVAPFITGMGDAPNYVFQIYRPGQLISNEQNEPYFEIGRQYPTLLDSLGVLVHGGEVTNQDTATGTPSEINLYQGDIYFRSRSIPTTDTGTVTFNVQDLNFVDFYISAVSSVDGRTSIIDINQKPTRYGALIRFGQAYQPNTNINGLNRFYYNNTYDLDITYGNVVRFSVRDRFIRAFQQFKVGRIPVFHQIQKDTGGNNISVITDKLLNPIQYDIGDFGIGDQGGSLASHDYADWFSTNIKGVICRVSNDGVINVSELYKMDSWATENLPLRTYNIYGSFDQRVGRYILALEAVGNSPAQTLMFSEKDKSFDSFLSYKPEAICNLGVLLVSFKNGDLYTHDSVTYNRFYDVDYPSYIVPVFNDYPKQRKTFETVEVIASEKWLCPEIITSLISYGSVYQQSNLIEQDFDLLEGGYSASFLRDANSQGGLINGDFLHGFYLTVKFQVTDATELLSLSIVTVYYITSPLNPK